MNEIQKFGIQIQNLKSTYDLQRLKAALERGIRLANYFTIQISDIFQANVQELGRVFKINDYSIQVFSESFIRSHLMFQFSKSLELAITYIRHTLNLPPFLIIS